MHPQLKRTIALCIKLLIGIISFYIIYRRLNQIPHFKEQCLLWLGHSKMYVVLAIALFLMTLNWGIESLKWNIITQQVEKLSYLTSVKSVLTGICIGNVAPGRAMEFLAKIYYFSSENRPKATILHFVNGMFQMLITVSVGLVAIVYKVTNNSQSNMVAYVALSIGVVMIAFFCWAIFNVSWIQQKLQFIKWFKQFENSSQLSFSKPLVLKLIMLSILRYLMFTAQFFIIYKTLVPQADSWQVFTSVAAYFVITSIIPMISIIEPAIRAAIAILVFNQPNDNETLVALTATLLWLINVVLPSMMGYAIILKEKINFKKEHAN